jgi:phage gpG-like protein
MMPMDLNAAALKLALAAETLPKKIPEMLEKAAQIVEDEAKASLGEYQAGWPKLKPQTIARKATGDSPLLETGDLRMSIEHHVDAEAHEGYVGSNNPKARWHELGRNAVAMTMRKPLFVVWNIALAGMSAFLAWRMSSNVLFVFAAGYLCAVFAERGWNRAVPNGLHCQLWPLK